MNDLARWLPVYKAFFDAPAEPLETLTFLACPLCGELMPEGPDGVYLHCGKRIAVVAKGEEKGATRRVMTRVEDA